MKDFWKNLACGVIGVLVTSMGFWLVEVKDYTKSDDVRTLIHEVSPYLRDKSGIERSFQAIDESISRTNKSLDETNKRLDKLNDTTVDLKVEVSRLNQKLEQGVAHVR